MCFSCASDLPENVSEGGLYIEKCTSIESCNISFLAVGKLMYATDALSHILLWSVFDGDKKVQSGTFNYFISVYY